MLKQLRQSFLLCLLFTLVVLAGDAWAQGISLPASGTYTQTFDNLSSGLPEGWTVQTGARTYPPSLGTSVAITTAPVAWNDLTAGYKNVASADGLLQTTTVSDQAASTDRALGVRQNDTFGDPGVAFMLQIANTLGASDLKLKFKIQSLDATASRITSWRVEYGLGQSPADYFPVGSSFLVGGNIFSNTEMNIDFGSYLNNNTGPVWIRIIANTPSMGSGNRPTTAIDDVSLSYKTTTNYVNLSAVNTINYVIGEGPATESFSISANYLTGAPSSLTITSLNPSVFTISSDNLNFGSSIVIPYTSGDPFSSAIKIRFNSGLPVGTYSGALTVVGGGFNGIKFIYGVVSQSREPSLITTVSSLTGSDGFQNYVGFDKKLKFLTLLGANLNPGSGVYTITSTNPSAFKINAGYGSNSVTTIPYSTANPPAQVIQVEFLGGLPAGEYTGNLVIEGGGATPISIPLSGTVSIDDTPPVIAVTPTILPAFSTIQGIPSAPQTVTLTGNNFDSMSGQINISSPTGFEVSFFNSPNYSQNPGIAPATNNGNFSLAVSVRMSGTDLGTFGGNILFTNAYGGAAPVTVAVSGKVNPVGSQPLSVTVAAYDCQTGAITFGRLGGDPNRAVEYSAIGVKSYSTNPNGAIEAEKRGDPNSGTTVELKARYVGDPASEVSYLFDFAAYCQGGHNPPTQTDLQLIEPLYNCQTGAITFRTQGGDGTPIEFGAIGIKSFSTNPNGVIEAEKRGDPNSGTTVELRARQSGKVVTYLFDFAAYCRNRNGRRAAPEGELEALHLKVVENPVSNELRVEVSVATNRPLQLLLTDLKGTVIEERNLTIDANNSLQKFDVHRQQPGMLLLRAISGNQLQTVKILKR